MLLDAYALDFSTKRAKGGIVESFEDDPDLSLDRIMESLDDGTWEDIESTFERPDEEVPPS